MNKHRLDVGEVLVDGDRRRQVVLGAMEEARLARREAVVNSGDSDDDP